jgi:hypothetical protein
MAIDVHDENLVLFNKTGDYWPIKPAPHVSAAHRWRLHGLKARSGQVVRLETIMLGGRRYTSLQATARFIAALNTESGDSAEPKEVVAGTASRAMQAGHALAGIGC